jgi:hypothetical protein
MKWKRHCILNCTGAQTPYALKSVNQLAVIHFDAPEHVLPVNLAPHKIYFKCDRKPPGRYKQNVT